MSKSPHRSWDIPQEAWTYYQEWNKAIFLHWEVPFDLLSPLVPKNLTIDHFQGKYWVTLVAFTMEKTSLRNVPAISAISDFHEVNIRTYVVEDQKPGVYFLNIEAGNILSTLIARTLSGLPYEKSNITRTEGKFHSLNSKKGFFLDANYEIGKANEHKDDLDIWLTERYCLYHTNEKQKFRYEIDHEEWPLRELKIKSLELNYDFKSFNLSKTPVRCHYSDGVKVLAWSRNRLN